MQAMNKYRFKAISTSIMAVFNIIISIFLAKAYGAVGAAIGTAIAIIICNVFVINIYYKKAIGLDVIRFWKEISLIFLKLLVPIVLTVVIVYLTKLQGWTAVLAYGGFYVIIYSVIVYLFVMNKYEKNIIKSLYKKIFLRWRKG